MFLFLFIDTRVKLKKKLLPNNEYFRATEEVWLLSTQEDYIAICVPAEWIEPLQKLGYTTIDKLKEVEKPGKLANDLNGFKKKNKLDLPGLSPEVVGGWIKD